MTRSRHAKAQEPGAPLSGDRRGCRSPHSVSAFLFYWGSQGLEGAHPHGRADLFCPV